MGKMEYESAALSRVESGATWCTHCRATEVAKIRQKYGLLLSLFLILVHSVKNDVKSRYCQHRWLLMM